MWSKTISLPLSASLHPSSHHLHRVIIQHKWISRCWVPFLNFPKKIFSKCCFIWCPELRKILQVTDSPSFLSYFRLPEADAQRKTNPFCRDCIFLFIYFTLHNPFSFINFANVTRKIMNNQHLHKPTAISWPLREAENSPWSIDVTNCRKRTVYHHFQTHS